MSRTPQNAEAEKAILAGILSGAKFDFRELAPGDFFVHLHAKLYARFQMMTANEEPLNLLSVLDPMQLDEVEMAAVGALQNPLYGPFTRENLQGYVRLIKIAADRRRLQKTCQAFLEAKGDLTWPAVELKEQIENYLGGTKSTAAEKLGFSSTKQLFTAQEKDIEWLCWPFAALGLASIVDGLPKLGKSVLLLHGILASRLGHHFLNFPTKPMRVVYVSEQSKASLAMQARDIGFTGKEPVEELVWITREDWSRYVYTDFLAKLEDEIIKPGSYNCLVEDTFHTIARMEDEKDASEANRLGNLTIDVATRNSLALVLGRHDRKSGGEIGISGRSSIQLSGLVDVILHLVRVPNQTTQRKLELLGRIPGLPSEQLIDLVDGVYVNWGQPEAETAGKASQVAQVAEWLLDNPKLTGEDIVARFAAAVSPIRISVSTAKRYRTEASAKREENSERSFSNLASVGMPPQRQ